jgi:hypothetical protein
MFNKYIIFFFKNILSLLFKDQRKIISFFFTTDKHRDVTFFDIYNFFRKILFSRSLKNRSSFFYLDFNKFNNLKDKTSVFKNIPTCFVYNFRKPLVDPSKSSLLYDRRSFLIIKNILSDFKNIPFIIDNFPDNNLNSNYSNYKDRTDIFYPFLRFYNKDNWFYFIIIFYFFFEFFIILFSIYFFFGSLSDLFIFIKNNFIIISPFSLLQITSHKILTFIFFCSFFFLFYNIIELIFQPDDVESTFANFSISKKNTFFFSFLLGFFYDIFYIIPLVFLWIFFTFSFLSFFLISFRFFLFPFLFFPFLFFSRIFFLSKDILFYENYWITYNQTFFQKIKNYFSTLDKNFFYDNKDNNVFLDKKINKNILIKNFSKFNFRKRRLRNFPLRLNINNIFFWNLLPNKTKRNNFNKVSFFDNMNFNFLESRDKQLFPRFRSYKIKNPLLNNYMLYRKLYLLLKKKSSLLKSKKSKRRSYFFKRKNSFIFSSKFPISKSFIHGTLSFKESKFFKKHKKEYFLIRKNNNKSLKLDSYFENYFNILLKNLTLNKKKYLGYNINSIPYLKNKFEGRKNIDIAEKLDDIFNLNNSDNRISFIKYYTVPSIFEKRRRIIKQNYRKFLNNLLFFKYHYPSNKPYYPLFINFSNFINNFKIEMLNNGLNSRLNSKNLLLDKNYSDNLFKLNRRLIHNLKKLWEERNDKISKKKKKNLNLFNWKSILQRTSYLEKHFSEIDKNFFIQNKYLKKFIFLKTVLSKNKNLFNYFKDYNNFLKTKRKIFLLNEKEKYIEENEKKFDKFLFLKNYKDFLTYFNIYKNRHFFSLHQRLNTSYKFKKIFYDERKTKNFLRKNYISPFITLYFNKNFLKLYGNKLDNSIFSKFKNYSLLNNFLNLKKKSFKTIKFKTSKLKIPKKKKKFLKKKKKN